MKARDKMAYGQYLAGIAFNNASLGYVHAMAHQLGGFYNLPHGVCNAILLPHVEEFNLIGNANRFRDIARQWVKTLTDFPLWKQPEKPLQPSASSASR